MNPSEFKKAIQKNARHRRRVDWSLTPEQRMHRFEILQVEAMKLLATNPKAMDEFIRRNHHARRMSSARQLEAKLLRVRDE
jgi:hypothetical protein